MRILLDVLIPHEPFNTMVRNGTSGSKIRKILDETKPEAVYFTERRGCRGATLIVNLDKSSDIPSLAEPWFLTFNADCHFRLAMTPEDLGQAGLEDLGKKWG